MSTYVDTSAFMSLANSEDDRHESAVRTWNQLVDGREMIITSNYVVLETIALLHSRYGTPAVRRFTEDVLSVIMIEWVDVQIHTGALSAVLASSGKQSPSLVDCVSFEIIDRSRIDSVFVYDRHFQDRGFSLVG